MGNDDTKKSVNKAGPGTSKQPSAGNASKPAGNATKPSSAGNASKPSSAGNTSKPSAAGNATKPSSAGNASKPSAAGNATKPSSAGNASKPSSAGNASKTSTAGNALRPSSAGNAPIPPTAGNGPQPPSGGGDGSHAQFELKEFSLSYYDAAGTCKPYPPNSREFVLVADTYRIGLELLSRSDVEPHLIELGNRCVQAWNDPENAKKYKNYQWPGNISNMREYVQTFLTGFRKSPPRIIVDSSLGNVFANTVKDAGSSYTGNLENFRPKDLVHFELNGKLVECMKRNDTNFLAPWDPKVTPKPSDYDKKIQVQDDRWQTLRFVTSITWFHEFCHAFVTFLAGNNYADTPTSVTNAAFTDPEDTAGESGFWTETRAFAGCALMDPSMPNGDPEEAVRVYLVNDNDDCRDVNTKTMREMMTHPKSYNLRNGIKTVKPWKRTKSRDSQSSHTVGAGPKSRVGIAACKKSGCWDLRFIRARGERIRVEAVASQA